MLQPGGADCWIWVGGGCPSLVSEMLAALTLLPPPVSGPPLPSPAHTTEAFQRKLLLILAVIPGHPHPQLPLPLWAPEKASGHSFESRPKALMGESQVLPPFPAANKAQSQSRETWVRA